MAGVPFNSLPDYRQVPTPDNMQLVPQPQQSWKEWFGGFLPDLQWGGEEPLPPPEEFSPQPRDFGPWPGQNTQMQPPPMPAPPQASAGLPSGTSTQWGGYEQEQEMTPESVSAPYSDPSAPQKYSFLDNPGASDALVAFGAAMLKAPDFNTGLGNAALAVNQVAKSYRPLSEQEINRARQLAQLDRLRRGESSEDQASGLQVDTGTTFKSAEGDTLFSATTDGQPGMYNATKGQFMPFGAGAPGLGQIDRDSYDPRTNRDKVLSNKDAQFEAEYAKNIPNIAASVANLTGALELSKDPTAAVDSDIYTRIGGEIERLMPGLGWQGFDANSITEYDNRIRNAAIQYARQSFQGQGQVTEWERRMIDEAIGQRGTLTNATAQKILRVMRDAEQRKIDMFNEWNANIALKERFGYNFGAFVGWYINDANKRQMGMGGSGSANSGTTSGGLKWSVE